MNETIASVKKGIDAIRRYLDPPLEANAPPIEIRAAVVDAVERHVAVAGIGKRLFPYAAVSVTILLPRPEDRAAFELVFEDLEPRLAQRLRELRSEMPSGFVTRTTLLDEAPAGWIAGERFAIDYTRPVRSEQKEAPAALPTLHLAIVQGAATRESYSFQAAIVLIGRTAAARDTRGRVRRNHVAFDQRSPTVSRAHARIVFDTSRGEYRLLDDGSARGTRLVRGDITMDVPPRHEDSRGVRLESGDEIHAGDATMRVLIGPGA